MPWRQGPVRVVRAAAQPSRPATGASRPAVIGGEAGHRVAGLELVKEQARHLGAPVPGAPRLVADFAQPASA